MFTLRKIDVVKVRKPGRFRGVSRGVGLRAFKGGIAGAKREFQRSIKGV